MECNERCYSFVVVIDGLQNDLSPFAVSYRDEFKEIRHKWYEIELVPYH